MFLVLKCIFSSSVFINDKHCSVLLSQLPLPESLFINLGMGWCLVCGVHV